MTPLVSLRDIVIEYDSGGYPVRPIDGLTLDIEEGELVVLLGPSGCGKTSLLSAIGGILRPTAGQVLVDGTDVGALTGPAQALYRQRTVGFVFQAFNLIRSLTARENVAVPLMLAGVDRAAALARAQEALTTVGLAERFHSRPGSLSGGQQQRVAVARGLAAGPKVLLADEPTANLDYIQAEGIITLLRDLRSSGRTIVVSTHDDRLVPVADRVVHLVPEFRADDQPPQSLLAAADEVIFEQGSRGELVYVIDKGRVEITRRRSDGAEERLARLGPGEYFGELGPLFGFPRTATARASTAVRLTAYNIRDFREQVLKGESPAKRPPRARGSRPRKTPGSK